MKFRGYYKDFELYLKSDKYYDFSNGKVCLINDVTYLAIHASFLKDENSIVYALFEWGEQEFADKKSCVEKAAEISKCIAQFANCTIDCALNEIMPFDVRDTIRASIKHCRAQRFPIRASVLHGVNISLEETQNNVNEKAWTIVANDKEVITLNNETRAKYSFQQLLGSINHYIEVWFKSITE